MRGKDLSKEEKARIILWRREKMTIKTICERSGRSKTSVQKIIALAKNFPFEVVAVHKPRTGRPRKTSKDSDALIKRDILKNPCLTASALKMRHPDILGHVAVRTIQHRLQKELFPSRMAANRKFISKSHPSRVKVIPLDAGDLPVKNGNHDCDVTSDKELPMDVLHKETDTTLEVEEKEGDLMESSLCLDLKDDLIDMKDLNLSSVSSDIGTPNFLIVDVKKDIVIKEEPLDEAAVYHNLRDPKDSGGSVILKREVVEALEANEFFPQIKEEVLSESAFSKAGLSQEEDRLYIDSKFDTQQEPSSSYVVKKQDVDMSLTPIQNFTLGQLKEEINIKSDSDCLEVEGPVDHIENPVDHFEGIERKIPKHPQVTETKEEELEVFDGLQNLKLPLFTIKYPGNVSNPLSDCVVSVAVIQPNSYGVGVVTLPSRSDAEKGLVRKKRPSQKSRKFACDMLVGICKAKFMTWKHLEDHRKTHLCRGRRRKTWQCDFFSNEMKRSCNVRVSKKSTLEKHLREHHDYADYY